MNPSEPAPPLPPPDDEFSRMIAGALNDRDLSLTDDRRAVVLGAFSGTAQTDGGSKRRVIHFAWWLAAGAAAAACVVLWLSQTFNASPELAVDRGTAPVIRATAPAGEQLERANLRLAVLSEQLSRAEHQLIWYRAREEKIPSN